MKIRWNLLHKERGKNPSSQNNRNHTQNKQINQSRPITCGLDWNPNTGCVVTQAPHSWPPPPPSLSLSLSSLLNSSLSLDFLRWYLWRNVESSPRTKSLEGGGGRADHQGNNNWGNGNTDRSIITQSLMEYAPWSTRSPPMRHPIPRNPPRFLPSFPRRKERKRERERLTDDSPPPPSLT